MQTEYFQQKGHFETQAKIYILRVEEPPRGLEAFCKGANGFRVFTPPLGCSFLQDSCFSCQVHNTIELEWAPTCLRICNSLAERNDKRSSWQRDLYVKPSDDWSRGETCCNVVPLVKPIKTTQVGMGTSRRFDDWYYTRLDLGPWPRSVSLARLVGSIPQP